MLSDLTGLYDREQLLDLDLRLYYDVIKTGSYYVDSKIVIVFKVPIISPRTYDLYKLTIAPNKSKQILIPPYPLIATSGNMYVYIEAECPKYNSRYLCQEKLNQHARTEPDCIHKLIANQLIDASCHRVTVSLSKDTMEKLDDRNYVLVLPKPTKTQITCERDEYRTLEGSFLVTIPLECSLRTKELTIYNSNDRVDGQPMKIISIPADQQIAPSSQHTTDLTSINLSDLRNIQARILSQTAAQLDQGSNYTLYHTTLPFYVILCICILTIVVLCRKYVTRLCNRDQKPEAPADHYAEPGPTPTHQCPATFLLNVKK